MKRSTLAALLCGVSLLAAPAVAQETLVLGNPNPDQHPLTARILAPWVQAINADGAGVIEIEMQNNPMLVSPTNFYDRLQDDVAQMVWGLLAFDTGRFPRALVNSLPFLVPNSQVAAMATCRLYEAGAYGDEMANVVPLLFVQFPQASLHLNGREANSLASMEGLKIMTGSPVVSGLVQGFGGTPLSIILPEWYQSVQRGTADGFVMNWTAFPGFRLNEVTTHHLEAPLGGGLGMVFMMRDRYEALPEAAREVIARHTTCERMAEIGAEVDRWEADARGFVVAQGGHTFVQMTDEEIAQLQASVGAGVEAGFAQRVPGGGELIGQFRAAIAAASQ